MARSTKVRTGDVRIEGLREVDKALKELGPEARKELRATNRDVAEKEAQHAAAAAVSIGGVAAKTAPSIKAVGSYQSAGLAFGGASYPFGAGAAFGGQGRPTTQQFQPWVTGGYFPFPQIKADSDDITDTYVDALNRLIEKAFPD